MQLADQERVITEVPLGRMAMHGSLTLTNRRLVAVAPDSEESIPLAKISSIRSSYLRDYAAAVTGVIIFVLAFGFAGGYKTMETALNGAAMNAQKRFFDKGSEADKAAEAESGANAYGRYINIPAGLVWLVMLPLLGWGGYKTYKGLVGETELAIGTAAGEFLRTRDGERSDFRLFVEEAGRHLP
jgi:hypothetical protein